MNALSLFNGISGLHLALDRAGIEVNQVYYSEIDKFANKVTEHHYPNDISLGDVTKWKDWDIDWSSIDLVGAGFPCQAWSVAGKQLGDKDERGMLFWTTLDIIAHVLKHNPNAKFLMENVKMKKDFEEYITYHTTAQLGYVEKTLINSALVSAQNRNRYYWTNFPVSQPDDEGILLKDILEQPMDDKYNLSDEVIARFKPCKKTNSGQIGTTAHNGKIGQRDRVYDADGKMITLTATIYKQPPQYAVHGGAIRGRYNKDGTTSQKLECNGKEKTNSLTTVQKDNVVVYRPCERIKDGNEGHIANATDIKGMDCIKRVYGQDGKSPTLTTMGGGHREPKVLIYRPASIVGRRINEKGVRDDYNKDVKITQCLQVKHNNKKMGCLTTVEKDTVLSLEDAGRYVDIYNRDDIHYRKLTPLECERLQTLPDNWTAMLSNSQRYKSIGNGWTIKVISHILKSAF